MPPGGALPWAPAVVAADKEDKKAAGTSELPVDGKMASVDGSPGVKAAAAVCPIGTPGSTTMVTGLTGPVIVEGRDLALGTVRGRAGSMGAD